MKELFNENWKFKKYSIDTKDAICLNPEEVVSSVDIPHDWLIYNSNDLYEDSIGVYKKEFELNDCCGKRFFILFDGVYMDSSVYINGHLCGNWKYGYTAFEYELTDYVHEGINTLMVKVVYKSPNTRWYSGAGIFRNVWLKTTGLDYLKNDGTYVVTRKDEGFWEASIDTEVVITLTGDADSHALYLENILTDMKGNIVGKVKSRYEYQPSQNCSEGVCNLYRQTVKVTDVTPWSLENPYLYTLETKLYSEEKCIDECTRRIGFRTIRFDCNEGFFLNDKHIKINGVCEHHDLGALGSAFNLQALRRKFTKLKAMGVNSIRTSHNPPAREFYDLTDEMGILIDSEIFDMWESPKTEFDYGNYFNECWQQDVDSWIRRDRNHPSIIMWSIGNEIYDTQHGRGLEITRNLRDRVRLNDPCKNAYTTLGSNSLDSEAAQACTNELDLAGYNYGERLYDLHHEKFKDWCIYGSETSSTVQSRGVYHFPASSFILTHMDEQCSSLGNGITNWSAESSEAVVYKDRDAKYSIGQYIWTGWDYIGEPTPYFNKNSYFGQIDTAGFEKDTFYLYQAEWTNYKDSPMVHILPYWNFNEGQLIDIRIYSNCPKVELFFNEVSQGDYVIDHENGKQLSARYTLPYSEGTIKAVAYDENGKVIATDTRSSFGDASKINLIPDKKELVANGTDIIFVEINVEDENGIFVANANNRIEVSVEGAGRLVGLDNGDSTDYDSYKGTNKRLFKGRLLAMVAAGNLPGTITVTAKSVGLTTAVIELQATECLEKHIPKFEKNEYTPCNFEIPIRQIKLHKTGNGKLSPSNKTENVSYEILPANATYREVNWIPFSPDGIESNVATVKDGLVNALGDGRFRLCCYAKNAANHPEVLSEYEYEITGMGSTSFDPYKLVSAILRTNESSKNDLSFQGGLFIKGGTNWISFDRVDFGDYGSDEITLPIFAFTDTLPLEIWEGIPNKGGKLLAECEYSAKSWYNHYQENTFKLSKRLKGMKTLSIVTKTDSPISVQGFYFKKLEKSYSQIDAVDCIEIYGDSYQKLSDAIVGIGNNVSINFGSFDFSKEGTSAITVCGRSNIPVSALNIVFKNEKETFRRSVDFTGFSEMSVQTMEFEQLEGKYEVSFIFFPGSNFDMKWFKFS